MYEIFFWSHEKTREVSSQLSLSVFYSKLVGPQFVYASHETINLQIDFHHNLHY